MVDLKTTLKSGDYRVLPATTSDQVEVSTDDQNLQVLIERLQSEINSLKDDIAQLRSTTAHIEI